MKKFKLYFSVLILFSISTVAVINFYLNYEAGSIGKYRTGDNMYRDYNLHKYLNYFSFDKIFSKKIHFSDVDFFLDFSKNDLNNFDSIINLSKTHRQGFLSSSSKTWRSTTLRTPNELISAKVKLHGAGNFIYTTGNKSYRVVVKDEKTKKFEFRLINSFKEGYFEQIFLNQQINNRGILGPDPGKIVLVSDGNEIKDMRYTEDISSNLLESKLNHSNYKILKLNSNWNRNSPPHFNNNFHTAGFSDDNWDSNDSISFTSFDNYLKRNQSFLTSINKKEWGKYVANIFFWGQLHSYIGDNVVFLYDYNKSIMRPISRHEGPAKEINVLDYSNFIHEMIDNYNVSDNTISSLLWLLSDYEIKTHFNRELFDIINSKDEIISNLDSIYNISSSKHIYNEQFDIIKYRYSKLRRIVSNNSNIIDKYLKNSFYVVNSFKDVFEVYSDSDIPIKILETLDGQILSKKELKYNRFKNENFKKEGFVRQIKRNNNFSELILINNVTKDTINEENITYNNFNFNKL